MNEKIKNYLLLYFINYYFYNTTEKQKIDNEKIEKQNFTENEIRNDIKRDIIREYIEDIFINFEYIDKYDYNEIENVVNKYLNEIIDNEYNNFKK